MPQDVALAAECRGEQEARRKHGITDEPTPVQHHMNLTSIADGPRLARTLAMVLPDTGVLVGDTELRVVAMDGTPYVRHGYSAGEAMGRPLHEILPESIWASLREHWHAALGGESRERDIWSTDRSRVYWVRFAPLTGADDRIVGVIALSQDVTQRVRDRDTAERRAGQQAAISRLGAFALAQSDPAAVMAAAAEALHEVTGADIAAVAEHLPSGGIALRALCGATPPPMPEPGAVDPNHLLYFLRSLDGSVLSHDLSDDVRFRSPGLEAAGMLSGVGASIGRGERRFGFIGACSRRPGIFDEDHRAFVEAIANIVMTAIERARAEREAREREAALNEAQRLAGVGSWEIDPLTGRTAVSDHLREMLEVDPGEEPSDELFLSRVHPDDRAGIQELIAADPLAAQEYRVLLPSGRVRLISSRGEAITDDAGEVVALRGTVQDITDQRAAERAVRESEERFRQGFDNAPIGMALLDARTGTFVRVNRAYCRLQSRSETELLGLTFDDLTHPEDRAIGVQEMHDIVGGRLQHCSTEKRYLRPDRSVVWVELNVTGLRGASGEIEMLFCQVLDVSERKVQERRLERRLREISWVGEIRAALAEDRFELHAQPIVELATGEVVQRELLLRMRDRHGGLILPGEFLGAAEEHGVIGEIDRWVIAEGARLAAQGRDVEINLSAHSMDDPGLLEVIRREIERSGAEPGRLVFEVTETSLIARTDHARELAESLRSLGCRFALDDFGAGYGGFHYLRNLPLDFIKIDREFVRELLHNPNDRHLIEAAVGLARGFELEVIAEGVEDEGTLELLRELGVTHAQGYFLGRPAPI
jgi:PAS domain S-box-containing protein